MQQFDNVEFISVNPSLCDNSKGKGYNEMILISNAINQSAFIKESGCFLKVTGRYPIYNLQHFVQSAQNAFDKGYDLYCDVKDHNLYDLLRLGWSGHSFECRLLACNITFYKNEFEPVTSECNDYEGRLLEDVLFKAYKKSTAEIVDRFKKEPHFGGLAGHQISAVSFSQGNDSYKAKVKRFIGNSIRLLMPWFKF